MLSWGATFFAALALLSLAGVAPEKGVGDGRPSRIPYFFRAYGKHTSER